VPFSSNTIMSLLITKIMFGCGITSTLKNTNYTHHYHSFNISFLLQIFLETLIPKLVTCVILFMTLANKLITCMHHELSYEKLGTWIVDYTTLVTLPCLNLLIIVSNVHTSNLVSEFFLYFCTVLH